MKYICIIVSYNFMSWVDKCITTVMHSKEPCDILVVDNHSVDGTQAYIKSHYPMVMLMENERNLGFGRANNIGMTYALENHYDGVLLLNQDAWIDADTLGRLSEAERLYPDYGVLSPVHLTSDRLKPEQGFSVYSGVADLNAQPDAEVVAVPFVNAAIWYIPVSTIKRVGMFSPLFYHYGEDKDFINRLAYYGLKMGYVPRCYACHARENRKVTRQRFFRSESTYSLSEFANINYSFGRAFAMGVLALWKKAVICLLKLRLTDCVTYVNTSFQLLMQTSKVIKARKQSKYVKVDNYI